MDSQEQSFIQPARIGFTVYSKYGCPDCYKTKALLSEKSLVKVIVECDEYMVYTGRSPFFKFINDIVAAQGSEIKMFPIVFYDGKYIGHYNETRLFVDKLLLSFDECF